MEISHNRDFGDIMMLRNCYLSGSAAQPQESVNQFFRAYPQFQLTPTTAADADQAIQLAELVRTELDCSSYLESDLPLICALFRAFDRLEVCGGHRIDGRWSRLRCALLDDQMR